MPKVDVVVPVYNEEKALPKSIPELRAFLRGGSFPYEWRIVIADNASIDETPAVSRKLEDEYPGEVTYVRIERKGRGYALKKTWGESTADVMSYMDVDLSTGLEAFPPLIKAIAEEGYGVSTGSRLAPNAQVERSLKRTVLSRGYNLIIKAMMWTRFSDAQCGFKAISREVAQRVLPLIQDNNWFFDTELLVLAEKMGYKIKDVPVRWVEDPDTRVKIGATVSEDLRGLWRMRRERPWRAG
ncbi:MAG TPA: dolichyl-phosphate beta-glucosyltransferase [Dehalococcoidia bacterium]|nr:dolichyl-phosphate beta-glucosyltransferase [Dehalococcoidia bacterium]